MARGLIRLSKEIMGKIDRLEQELQRRQRIARTAFELFARSGLEAISAADIARAAYVSRTNLYRYFPSKLHMLLAHFELTVQETLQAAQRRLAEGRSPQDIWKVIAGRMAELGVRYHHLVGAVASAALVGRGLGPGALLHRPASSLSSSAPSSVAPAAELPRSALSELALPVLQSMRERGQLRSNLDLRMLSQLMVDTCLLALLQGSHRTPEEVEQDWQDRLSLLLGGVLRPGCTLDWPSHTG